jgi:hypothetical protein
LGNWTTSRPLRVGRFYENIIYKQSANFNITKHITFICVYFWREEISMIYM